MARFVKKIEEDEPLSPFRRSLIRSMLEDTDKVFGYKITVHQKLKRLPGKSLDMLAELTDLASMSSPWRLGLPLTYLLLVEPTASPSCCSASPGCMQAVGI